MTVGELKQMLNGVDDDEVVGVRVPMLEGENLVMLLDVTTEKPFEDVMPKIVLVTSKAMAKEVRDYI